MFGSKCDTNIRKAWFYYPEADAKSLAAFEEQWDVPLWNELMSELDVLQRSNCSTQRVHFGLIGANAKGAGLASTLRYMTGYLSDAYAENKGFMFAGRLNYAGTRSCKARNQLGDIECFLQPLSGCTQEREQAFARYRNPNARNNRCMRNVIGTRCTSMQPYLQKKIPEKYSKQGNFWWRSAMLSYLMRLSDATEEWLSLEQLKADIGFKHPIIGVHVRHGDACHTTTRKGTCSGLSTYMQDIEAMSERYNTTRVYLSTDDEAVVREARQNTKYQFVINQQMNRKVLDSAVQIEYRRNLWDGSSDIGHGIALSTFQDVLLLAEADYLILHLLSNMSRMALELSAARRHRLVPFSSKDGPWCAHW
eukprot:CAMPEP_0114292300 /NCGR_PEP_ID=MMETSP0059-20121206/8984_1 /TAXON_ID=36894 /ORGANISM="Pyramimonas parkeae, Strain CCMP726" /LENGTH=363 /DNA_ID=CAMNT_0001413931 /DNA_START=36 /DNA_END=1124 /DNA_ORIENTATION=-